MRQKLLVRDPIQNPLKSVERLCWLMPVFSWPWSWVSLPLTFSGETGMVLSAAEGCLTSPFPAQICIECQVGHWLFTLFCRRALGCALAVDFQWQKLMAFSSNFQNLLLGTTASSQSANMQELELLQGTGEDQSLGGNFILQHTLMLPDLWTSVILQIVRLSEMEVCKDNSVLRLGGDSHVGSAFYVLL